MKEYYRIHTEPVCRKEQIAEGACYRISVLTAGLVRLEYSEKGIFEDRPTQVVWNRNLGACDYRVSDTEDFLEIVTDRIHLYYDKKRFSADGLFIKVAGGFLAEENIWHYGDTARTDDVGELRGTTRTLDGADGAAALEDGLISLRGYAVMDDSNSLVIREDGWIEARKEQEQDLYFWGYGTDYLICIQDFYRLCGTTPMVPRYALGNWWSRYHKYTETSYRELMERFAAEKIPFAVAVIDMDWHLVDVEEKYKSGWTGYTWNRELFPDPAGFLSWLHERKLHVTLNVHPADGVRAYEEMYEAMSRAMGMSDADRENELPVAFDVSDETFMEAYFAVLHHPQEEAGVDFWWIDWQQGTASKMEGLDPLWMLNHYHFLDNGRGQKRPMTFSRYAGPGSHRYPVGFSGDTVVTWRSLDFQPYFTASATNIGYGMWSHDIGGHMQGVKDDELSGRWVQYGVFSPIMRLHSTNSRFNSKEPWRFRPEIRAVMEEFLRLRHRMLPYLYTMNYRQYAEGIPVVLPMYYAFPNEREAYQVPNQYLFGSGLMVAAVTTPCIRSLRMAKVDAWIPEGEWYDIFTGMRYHGGRKMSLYRDIRSIPVLAGAGAVIPFQEDYMESADENPAQIHLYVYVGADGAFTLYEDDNSTNDYRREKCVRTCYRWQEEEGCLHIGSAEGETSLIPANRDYIITFCGIEDAQAAGKVLSGNSESVLAVNRKSHEKETACPMFSVAMENVPVNEEVVLHLKERVKSENNVSDRCFRILDRAEIAFDLKETVFNVIEAQTGNTDLLGQLRAMELDSDLYSALAEVITA
ncbi:MAG: glycoside hydrolase family 31 protein [Lachnospiraceae bacterium]|nr:glycoside hydrolase family 31 protein [Lachnospiraceae bacterium]